MERQAIYDAKHAQTSTVVYIHRVAEQYMMNVRLASGRSAAYLAICAICREEVWVICDV